MSDKSGDLVPERLGGNKSHLLDDALVDIEVQGQLGVVLLDDDLGGLLHDLGSDVTHLEAKICDSNGQI